MPVKAPHHVGANGTVTAWGAVHETTVGSFEDEAIRRQGPRRDADHIEVQTLHWIHRFDTERPHEYLDDLTPGQAERLHHHLRALAAAG